MNPDRDNYMYEMYDYTPMPKQDDGIIKSTGIVIENGVIISGSDHAEPFNSSELVVLDHEHEKQSNIPDTESHHIESNDSDASDEMANLTTNQIEPVKSAVTTQSDLYDSFVNLAKVHKYLDTNELVTNAAMVTAKEHSIDAMNAVLKLIK